MRVWDLPLRIFHWALVVAVIGAVASSKADVMWLHERFGLSVMGLIIFRLLWGIFGGRYARFAQFITSPKKAVLGIANLLKAKSEKCVGHSAQAGYAVMGLLSITAFLAITGSFSNDDVLFDGPLAHLLPSWSNRASKLHDWGEPVLFFMISLHIGAILFYKIYKKEGLTKSMLNGWLPDSKKSDPVKDGGISTPHTLFGILLLVICVLSANALTLLRPKFF